ncbi:MAG: FAD binding domain-containing protein [Rhodobacter sp.]|nr:FAD binding domain-containing protein [Rhodobacter sp.]
MFINTNTRLVSPEFDYLQPKTLAEAFSMLDEHGTSAKLLAGGTDLLVQMKMERQQPSHVISLSRVKELDGIKSGNGLTIGAMTSIRSVSRSEPVKARLCRPAGSLQRLQHGFGHADGHPWRQHLQCLARS